MKIHFSLVTFLALSLLLSCGKKETGSFDDVLLSEDVATVRAKKAELDKEYQDLSSKLEKLEEKIKELDPQERIPLVTAMTSQVETFEHFIELQGDVTTKRNIIIYPEFSGVLSQIYVREGQWVKKGQKLGKIEDGGLSAQKDQLEVQLGLAKTTYERQKRLWDQNIGSEISYLQAKASYEAMLKSIEQLDEQIGKTIVTAPFAGTIDEIITDQGSVVAPGAVGLFRLVNLRQMYIETDVPESYIRDIKPGKHVKVEFPVLDLELDSRVRQAGSFINPANRTFKIQVDVANKNNLIKPNMSAKLQVNDYTNKEAILLPQSVISENAEGKQYIFVIDSTSETDGVANQRIIETGRTQGDMIEVTAGLDEDVLVIVDGARSVKNNQVVKILSLEN